MLREREKYEKNHVIIETTPTCDSRLGGPEQ